jgi:hypothetical protein
MQELLALSDEDRQTAMDRFRLLQPHLEQNRSLRLVAAGAGLAFPTAQRWVALYRTSGLASVARKTRLDQGARRVVSEPMKRAIEGLALESHRFHHLRSPPDQIVCRGGRRHCSKLLDRVRHRPGGASEPTYPRSSGSQGIRGELRSDPSAGSQQAELHLAGRSCSARYQIAQGGWISGEAVTYDRDRRLQPGDRRLPPWI